MIRIIIAAKLDHSVVTIEHDQPVAGSAYGRSQHWHSIGYSLGPAIAHDETEVILAMLADALDIAERRAAEAGGWSALA